MGENVILHRPFVTVCIFKAGVRACATRPVRNLRLAGRFGAWKSWLLFQQAIQPRIPMFRTLSCRLGGEHMILPFDRRLEFPFGDFQVIGLPLGSMLRSLRKNNFFQVIVGFSLGVRRGCNWNITASPSFSHESLNAVNLGPLLAKPNVQILSRPIILRVLFMQNVQPRGFWYILHALEQRHEQDVSWTRPLCRVHVQQGTE
mmetsp:Transcript_7963/g.15462  ORF Transcript_7963/g.15462 Transcript_7963/m.15462 type:complete len:202 (+) Transcript_7963:1334-1939(+)